MLKLGCGSAPRCESRVGAQRWSPARQRRTPGEPCGPRAVAESSAPHRPPGADPAWCPLARKSPDHLGERDESAPGQFWLVQTAYMSARISIPPPGDALERWLHFLQPQGALVWKTLAAALPWTNPPGGGTRSPGENLLREVLESVGLDEASQTNVLSGPMSYLMIYSPDELKRNQGMAARGIQIAAEVDVSGTELSEISGRLGFTDHLVSVPGHDAPVPIGDPRRARRYLSQGRACLAALGVWPWAHVEGAMRSWWTRPEIVDAVIDWHDEAWLSAVQSLAWSARARKGLTTVRGMTVDEANACLDFRTRLRGLDWPPPHRDF